MKIQQIKDLDMPSSDVTISRMTSFLSSFCMYSFHNYQIILSFASQPRVSAVKVTVLLICGIIAGRQHFSSDVRSFLIGGINCLGVMRELHVRAKPARIQEHIQTPLILREDKVAVAMAEETKLSKPASRAS